MDEARHRALIRLATRAGEAFDGRGGSYKYTDALVENGYQCVFLFTPHGVEGYAYDGQKIFFDYAVAQYVLFPQALEIVGPF